MTLDATALVSGDNMFNDPPPEGSIYVMINITVSYNGAEHFPDTCRQAKAAVLRARSERAYRMANV